MNQINRIVDSIQYELEKLRTLGIDVSILEKEVYKLSIPEDKEKIKKNRILKQKTLGGQKNESN